MFWQCALLGILVGFVIANVTECLGLLDNQEPADGYEWSVTGIVMVGVFFVCYKAGAFSEIGKFWADRFTG